ncbi:alpha/beta fold hydrolase [Streptomyces sp. NPDC059382]|uniref:alpha/beta fold hydrolase n=1 Tax=Streptomyces sp. NPDC059382 TaxID=3346816 RepID=UPI0036BD42B2
MHRTTRPPLPATAPVVAVDLPGHGPGAHFPRSHRTPQGPEGIRTEPSTTAEVTSARFTDHVADVLRRTHRLGPVLPVGQSMGALTLNTVVNRVPERNSHRVYVSAVCPSARATRQRLMTAPEAAGSAVFRLTVVPTPAERGVNRVNWRSGEPEFPQAAREGTAADRTDDEVRALLTIPESDEPAEIGAADTGGLPESRGRIPRTGRRFAEDRTIPPEPSGPHDRGGRRADPGEPLPGPVAGRSAHRSPRSGELELKQELVAGLCR